MMINSSLFHRSSTFPLPPTPLNSQTGYELLSHLPPLLFPQISFFPFFPFFFIFFCFPFWFPYYWFLTLSMLSQVNKPIYVYVHVYSSSCFGCCASGLEPTCISNKTSRTKTGILFIYFRHWCTVTVSWDLRLKRYFFFFYLTLKKRL